MATEIVVITQPTTPRVTVTEAASQTTITTPGPPGPPGSGGGNHNSFEFPTPSTSWPVNHGSGFRPVVSVLDQDGNDITVGVEINHINDDSFTVLSGLPIAGRVEIA